MNKRLTIVLAVLLFASHISLCDYTAQQNNQIRGEWMKGYDQMENADRAYESGNLLAALKMYNDALVIFIEVNRKYPQWHSSLQAFRLKYCREKVAELNAKVGVEISSMTPEAMREMLKSQAKSLQEQLERITQLTAALSRSDLALQRARAEAAQSSALAKDFKMLQDTKASLEERCNLLEAQIVKLQNELDKSGEASSARGGSGKNVEEQLKAAVRQLESVQSDNQELREQIQRLTSQLERSERQLREAKQQFEQSSAEASKIQQALQESRTAGAEEARKNAQLRESNGTLQYQNEQLQRENKLLKAQLDGKGGDSQKEELLEAVKRTGEELRQCREELSAVKAQNATLRDEISDARQDAQMVRNAYTQLEEQKNSLHAELLLVSSKYQDVNRQNADSSTEANQLREDMAKLLEEKTQLAQLLESRVQMVASLEGAVSELKKKYEESQTALRDAAERLERYQRAAVNSEAVEGMTRNYGDAVTEARAQKALAVQLQAKLDKAEDRIQELEEEKRQDNQLMTLLSAPITGRGDGESRVLEELRNRLQAEISKRQKLETLLIQRDSNEHVMSIGAAETELDANESRPNPMATPESSHAREQELLVNGFLRQGVDAEKEGRIETAQWNYEKVLEIDERNFIALKRMGLIAANAGDDEATIRYLKQAFREDPDDAEILLALGYSMLQMQQPEWALSILSRAVALIPDNAELQRQFAAALAEMNWTEAAIEQYKKAYMKEPAASDIPFNIAVLHLTRYTEFNHQATTEPDKRDEFHAQAERERHEACVWYRRARENGSPEDPSLERLLTE